MLAFYLYPFVENQKAIEYTRENLMNPAKVEELFDYCQICEGYITWTGWAFLISHYGYDGLYEIDKGSGWFDAENLEEFQLWVYGEIDCCIEAGLIN